MPRLLVNIDHIATLRNARGEGYPDIIKAAQICIENGAEGIVFHLREDRRHVKDFDVMRLKAELNTFLDFEMAATPEMLQICSETKPDLCTLVPESRQELTTEGGLNMKKSFNYFLTSAVPTLHNSDINISLFLDPEPENIDMAAKLKVYAVELHTGTYANSTGKAREYELNRMKDMAELIHEKGMIVNAGHGLNFNNIEVFLKHVPHLNDISIGHALISESIFYGLADTVKRMNTIIKDNS